MGESKEVMKYCSWCEVEVTNPVKFGGLFGDDLCEDCNNLSYFEKLIIKRLHHFSLQVTEHLKERF